MYNVLVRIKRLHHGFFCVGSWPVDLNGAGQGRCGLSFNTEILEILIQYRPIL